MRRTDPGAGRNVPGRWQTKAGTGTRKSKSRDHAMKAGDLRSAVAKTRSRFSRKAKSQADISHDYEPLPLDDDPAERARADARRNKLTARVASLKKA